jgi:hypothetical protein
LIPTLSLKDQAARIFLPLLILEEENQMLRKENQHLGALLRLVG